MEPTWRNVMMLLASAFLFQGMLASGLLMEPGDIVVTSITNVSISLAWERPAGMNSTQYNFSITYNSSDTHETKIEVSNFTTITGLLPGTNYTISVATINDTGAKSAPVVTSVFTKPNPVLNVTVVDAGTNFVTLIWMLPSDHKEGYEYMVLTRGNPAPSGENENITVKSANATIKGLTSGTKYNFTVITLAADGTQSTEVMESNYTRPVQIPQGNITVENNDTTDTLIVSWVSPSGNVEKFFVVLLNSSNIELQTISKDTVMPVEFHDLQPGREYNIIVITSSGPFNVASDSKLGITVPSSPGSITVTNFSTSFISLNWGAPANMDVGHHTFNVTYDNGSNAETITTNTNFITISNLTSGTKYVISVVTVGPGNLPSGPVTITQYTIPSSPGSITVTNFSTSFISLNWGAPANMDVGHHTFNVTYDNGSNAETITTNTNFITISNLTSGTKYVISVVTVGPGNLPSGPVTITQYTKPNPVRNVQIAHVTTNSITFNWTQPLEYRNEYSYQVETKESGTSSGNIRNEIVTSEQITVEDLIPGTNYTFSISTLAADNTSADAAMASSYTRPIQIPTKNITVDNNGTTDKLIISWAAPPGNVEKFFVRVQETGSREQEQVQSTDSTLSLTFTSLQPGREYSVTVVTNSGPFNETSEIVQGVTVPSIPGAISVTDFNTTSISINWGLPADMVPGSFSFIITYHDGSVPKSVEENVSFTTITNLTSGTNYTISVATIGPEQLQSDFVSISHFTKPNPVNGLQIVQFDTTSIILSWARPEQYKAEYRYKILTTRNTPPTFDHGNQTVPNENVTVAGLIPGTKYTFSVITLAEDGTEADPVLIVNYTEPLKIPGGNITLNHENTIDSLRISWILPPGGVENFTVDIEDCANPSAFRNSTTVTSSTNTVVFNNLLPGRLYCVNLTTISGPHRITSDFVKGATIPSPPGPIEVTSFTNSTIDFAWGRPENMDIGTYSFIVTYQIAQTANTISNSTEDNKSSIDNLESGTNYTIIIATIIPQNLNSAFVTRSHFTKPNPIRNLKVVSKNTVSINLSWDEPLGHRSEYRYRVRIKDSLPPIREINTTSSVISDLTSGANFVFTISTVAADDTESDAVTLNQCTDAAAVNPSSLKCTGIDLQPVLKLEWACPDGENTGFSINATNFSTQLTSTALACTSGMQEYTLNGVVFFTRYSVNVTTLSCGSPSTSTHVECRSGITHPPQPAGKLQVPSPEVTHKTITFEIKEGVFNSDNGPIKAIAVIVTKEESEGRPSAAALETAYDSVVSTYVAQVIDLNDAARRKTRAPALATPITVNVGNNDKSHGYVNQELTPLTAYRLSLVGFTKITFGADDKIISNLSFYSTYEYSEKIFLKQNPDVIIGAVVGTILGAAVIILLVVLLFWWKRRTKSNNGNLTQLPISNIREARRAINVEYFEGYFSKQHADSDCGFAEEYEELKTIGISQSTQAAHQPLNKPKNRYNNVLPYDASRVKLSVTADPSSDYINANFMPGYNSKKEFIAAQGPLMNTVSDFWRMIWEHYVPAVVMLTKCVEQGRAKCEQYWPTERPLIFEDKIVTLTSEIVLQDWTIRDFTIVKDKSGEKRALRHFHFTGWPDHGVPSTTGVLIEFRNLVRQYINQYPMSGPTVVHCSAGVGRTGTFISIDRMIYQIDNKRQVDIWGIVYELRMNRPLMVQTESQYVFLNQCAMEYIKASKQKSDDIIYQNTPALIYENASAIRAAHAANGHAL
ncbi:receptor-type tyrosine-protein phosphatase eta isoform X2 [Stegostoma tigrinum]|uniref:receptor-type tyrosine-protein phosphatase eta isoform X2 n=1 Tax=Stegostoma tigrinum TaxID=3053191 RepID=UPI00286FCE6F|nr:receptor-type tyrosine-protein phosphatase eta isoform X2 [Stegostoma tigrinum]